MKINFFEEFPTKNNLEKLKLVSWPATVHIAAKSVEEFGKIKQSISLKNIKLSYWPILKQEEGYWLSPFSNAKAVKRVVNEVKNRKINVMWDAELPFRHPWLFLRIDNFIRNKPLIKKFFKRNGKQVLTSEYPIKNKLMGFFFKRLGVSFSPKRYGNKKIIMYYTSMHKFIPIFLLKGIRKLHQRYGKNLQVGLGTIATGILGNEPILQPQELERDLKEMKKIGISEIVIFRLGGLNKEYVKVIKRYI